VQAAEERALRNSEATGLHEVEAAGTRLLDERVSVCREAVLDRERLDPVVGTLDRLARAELDEGELVAQASEHALQDPEEIDEARRPVDGQRNLAPAQGKRLQHPGEPEIVVGVVVRQEDLGELDEPD